MPPMLAAFLSLVVGFADVTPDPAAEKAFAEFLAAYRALPGLTVRASTVITAVDPDGEGAPVESKGQPVELTLSHGVVEGAAPGPDGKPVRRAVLSIKGYTCWLGDGFLTAVHESNPEAYFRFEDDGSPYYALTNAFADLPYPDLALALGEEKPDEALMQLNPKAPNVVPVGVVDEVVDGAARRTIKFAAEGERVDLVIDPASGLPSAMTVLLTDGPFVRGGGSLKYEHGFAYQAPKALTAEAVAFDPGKRQKVDLFSALVKREEPKLRPDGQREHALVGKPVPDVSMPLLGGGELDLGSARGKVLVLDFWATWCGPCKASMPALHEIAAAFKAEDAPVAVYAVNVFEQEKELEGRKKLIGDFWQGRKFTLPVALDISGDAGRRFEIPGIPMTVVVRSDGVVHAVHVGFNKDRIVADVKEAIVALEKPAEEGAAK